MGFDFAYTCPEIDSQIRDIESKFDWYFDSIVSVVERNQKECLTDIKRNIEEVRKTNATMRDAAEFQIDLLEDQIQNLENENSDLKNTIKKLESDLDYCQDQLKIGDV